MLHALLLLAAPALAQTPSDDPADWDVDPSLEYAAEISDFRQVVPSAGLPAAIRPLPSNNNVGIAFHDGRLFMAWRSGKTHFAGKKTRLYVASSGDLGRSWDFEHELRLGTDAREPLLFSLGGRLHFYFFEAGTKPTKFEPRFMWRLERLGPGHWTEPEKVGEPGEIPWDIKVRGGRAWMTSYKGSHYSLKRAWIDVRFQSSADGARWEDTKTVYRGGVSEAGFEFDSDGGLVAVLRNEDGDDTGFGSLVARAPAGDPWAWSTPARSDPERYDSPKMFRHGKDLYLVARRDHGGPFDYGWDWLPFSWRRLFYLFEYSLRPKGTALYKVEGPRVRRLLDLPGSGDTAFPSIARLDAHSFLVANYSSPLDKPWPNWFSGQVSRRGTQLHFLKITFAPRAP
jgi:hypothetical protein